MDLMKKRTIISYWLIILIPTLLISFYFFKLLSHERERLENEALLTVKNQAEQIAETIRITMDTVEDELGNALINIDDRNLKEVLLSFEKTNPLVRNVFIYNNESGLKYPYKGISSTKEEKLFTQRYDAFFSGRVKFESTIDLIIDEIEEEMIANVEKDSLYSLDRKKSGYEPTMANRSLPDDSLDTNTGYSVKSKSKKVRKKESGRKKLVSFARQKAEVKKELVDFSLQKNTEWLTWFSDNRLYILGWVKLNENIIYGFELEIVTILSQITLEFPEKVSDGLAYALTDGTGSILHKSGNLDIPKKSKPFFTSDLLPSLPHWQIAVYMDKNFRSKNRFDLFVILTGLLLGIFIFSIITGGVLLTLLAYRNMMDASQKTTFVSNVSHELKTPLTSIRMYAELLGEGRVKDEEKKKKYLEVIIDESRRLTRLVNNVLNFSRLESGLKKYNLAEISMTEYFKEIADSATFSSKGTKLNYNINIPGHNVKIVTDKDAIKQVMLNLIDNAIKYASDGKTIDLSMEIEENSCKLNVSDRGPGIPKDHSEKIFEKFHRVDNSLTSKKQGAGLGLSIAKNIVQDLGGSMIYEPRKGGGSSFIIILPLTGDLKNE